MNTWYTASDQPELVEFGTTRGLGVTGVGEPGGPEHMTGIQSIYGVAGRLLGNACPPLEGRWWVEDDRPPLTVPRAEWRWHLFLPLPESVDAAAVDEAREATGAKTSARVQLVTFTEGQCVQVMHVGPFENEPETLARMDRFMADKGLVPNGLHHEIYLSGLTERDPERMRTILRQPVRAA